MVEPISERGAFVTRIRLKDVLILPALWAVGREDPGEWGSFRERRIRDPLCYNGFTQFAQDVSL